MKLIKLAGATSEIWQIFIRDSSSTTGGGLTGLVFGSSGLTAYYNRDTDSAPTSISLVTMTAGTFTSSGFKEISSANMPGWYQFCPPNAALASGAKSVAIHLKGATNMAPTPIEVQLVAFNPDTASTGGIPVVGTGTNNFKSDSSANVTYANAAPPTAAAIATGVWQDTTAGDFTVALSVGKSLMNGVTLGTGLTVNDITTKTGFSLSGTQTFNVTGNITGNLSGSVGSVTGLTASNLDAAVSSRMATYSQPTGFLAATFPTTVASTTNITAGTITTVTNLTNAPTSGDFTSTMKTSIGTAVAASAVASVTGNVGGNVTGSVGSVVGAVGSVTGNVGGNVTGSVGSVVAVVSANITKVNGTTVTGDGSPGTEWGP